MNVFEDAAMLTPRVSANERAVMQDAIGAPPVGFRVILKHDDIVINQREARQYLDLAALRIELKDLGARHDYGGDGSYLDCRLLLFPQIEEAGFAAVVPPEEQLCMLRIADSKIMDMNAARGVDEADIRFQQREIV